MQNIITIPSQLTHGDELIVVRRKEYEKLQKHLAELLDAFSKIRRGDKELREGKTHVVKSLSDLRKR